MTDHDFRAFVWWLILVFSAAFWYGVSRLVIRWMGL